MSVANNITVYVYLLICSLLQAEDKKWVTRKITSDISYSQYGLFGGDGFQNLDIAYKGHVLASITFEGDKLKSINCNPTAKVCLGFIFDDEELNSDMVVIYNTNEQGIKVEIVDVLQIRESRGKIICSFLGEQNMQKLKAFWKRNMHGPINKNDK